jgi:hypothetical protein
MYTSTVTLETSEILPSLGTIFFGVVAHALTMMFEALTTLQPLPSQMSWPAKVLGGLE